MKLNDYKNLNDGAIDVPNEMFIYIRNSNEFKIYVYLCGKFDIKSDCVSVSMNKISKDTGLSLSTVKKSIKSLIDNGHIEKIKTDVGKSNCYKLFFMDSNVGENDDYEIITWQETIPEKRKNKRKDYAYTKWKRQVLERDNYTCQLCGKTDEDTILNVHHIEKYADNEELRTDIDNGITLCYSCHQKVFSKEKEFEDYFKMLIKEGK